MSITVFFDLDGVLANFVGGALRLHNRDHDVPVESCRWNFMTQLGFTGENDPAFWAPLGFDFWAGLSPYSDGMALLRATEQRFAKDGVGEIGLLTSPCDTPGCVDGKRAWVAKHLPSYRRKLFVGSAKQLFAGPGKLLIDDHDSNVNAFEAAGGRAVQPPRPWNRHRETSLAGGLFDVPAVYSQVAREIHLASIND